MGGGTSSDAADGPAVAPVRAVGLRVEGDGEGRTLRHQVTAVVPVKPLALAKSRLALRPEQRRSLALAFALDGLGPVRQSSGGGRARGDRGPRRRALHEEAAGAAGARSTARGSAAKHRALGLRSLDDAPVRARHDVDTLKDLQMAATLGLGPETAAVMAAMEHQRHAVPGPGARELQDLGRSIDDLDMCSMIWYTITDEKTDQTDNGKPGPPKRVNSTSPSTSTWDCRRRSRVQVGWRPRPASSPEDRQRDAFRWQLEPAAVGCPSGQWPLRGGAGRRVLRHAG